MLANASAGQTAYPEHRISLVVNQDAWRPPRRTGGASASLINLWNEIPVLMARAHQDRFRSRSTSRGSV